MIEWKRSLGVVWRALLLVGGPAIAYADLIPKAEYDASIRNGEYRVLNGSQIRELVNGRHAVAFDDPDDFIYYFDPDGTFISMDEGVPVAAEWSISDDKLCMAAEDDKTYCWEIIRPTVGDHYDFSHPRPSNVNEINVYSVKFGYGRPDFTYKREEKLGQDLQRLYYTYIVVEECAAVHTSYGSASLSEAEDRIRSWEEANSISDHLKDKLWDNARSTIDVLLQASAVNGSRGTWSLCEEYRPAMVSPSRTETARTRPIGPR